MLLVVAGLFVFGCAGQKTTTTQNEQGQAMPALNGTSGPSQDELAAQEAAEQQAIQQAIREQAQQALQNQTLPTSFQCTAGVRYSNQQGMQGTMVGVETYKGRQTCHITYSLGPDSRFDYYLDMSDPKSVCYVMSGGEGTEPTEVCDWQ